MNKLKANNVMMIVAIVLIFVYIIYEGYSVTHIKLQTETATLSTVYEKIDAKALIIRDERVIKKESGGVTVPSVLDGDKVAVGGNVAMSFASAEAAENYSKYAEVQSKIKYYENLESQTLGQAASVESINSEIDSKVDSYIRALNTKNVNSIETAGENANDAFLRRQMIIGEDVDLISIIQELRKQSDELASSSKPEKNITTDVSGVFSSYVDGFESELDYSKAEEMNADDIEKALDEISKSKKNDENALGKLITSYAWYIECVVDAQAVRELSNGSKVQIALKDSEDTVLSVQIVSGADVQPGQEKTALIMKCSNMDSKLASLRNEDIEIRIKSYEGFKVPSAALHIDKDGKKGVYALVSSQSFFREAEVIYSRDDYVMLKFDPDNSDGIRLYDQIIIQGKELDDGKVYS